MYILHMRLFERARLITDDTMSGRMLFLLLCLMVDTAILTIRRYNRKHIIAYIIYVCVCERKGCCCLEGGLEFNMFVTVETGAANEAN